MYCDNRRQNIIRVSTKCRDLRVKSRRFVVVVLPERMNVSAFDKLNL